MKYYFFDGMELRGGFRGWGGGLCDLAIPP